MPESPLPERVLVTGAGGQLGRALLACAPKGVTVIGRSRADLDIADTEAVQACIDREAPQLLINAAAYTAVDRAEDDPAAAYRINGEAPGLLAAACAARGVRLFHVSTDFVFDGAKSSPYIPTDTAAPLGVYGASKLAGELAVAATAPDALILRTGWVYSEGDANFLNTMLRLHAERDELKVVADQVGTPTAASSLARTLWSAAVRPEVSGVYHFSDAGACSWYDFAVAIGEEALALGRLAKTAQVVPIPSRDYPTPARRPAYSVLDKTVTWRDLQLTPEHWREGLRRTLNELPE